MPQQNNVLCLQCSIENLSEFDRTADTFDASVANRCVFVGTMNADYIPGGFRLGGAELHAWTGLDVGLLLLEASTRSD
jgi:hypothetical protein